ncbi:MAG: tetratricopeptide repeat protein [candidate division KSB1 bacterium]|nr:tetratricopeptide repeat protein [candidate division KSB1 bacterium]MDZ7275226.1 tetratricopeptide repeat protein [candidate division KSB1 bacterium]MDZ7287394.1 tetratricopeptide repeat protein [candidate division KSB1 bacterium]MDZ7299508.1 tetratricopeptide repeat protein [candidate division KSB1 bacterium]MDZ7305446.1 tetratricopeptide repeat protein [candidate division KSB1 bacterium]
MSCTYEDRLEIIAAYVRHELPEPARGDFEEHYLGCDECSRDLLLMEKTALVMKRHGDLIFAPRHSPALLGNFLHKKMHASPGPFALRWLRAHGPALAGYAVLVLLLGAGYFWLDRYQYRAANQSAGHFDEAGTAGPSIFAGQTPAFLRQPEWSTSSRAAGVLDSALAATWEKARAAYTQQQYPQALSLLAQLIQVLPDQPQLRLIQGVSLLRSGQPQAARAVLQALVARQPDDPAAQWFLAEACLKDDPKQAQLLYEKLAARGDSLYSPAARGKILRQ